MKIGRDADLERLLAVGLWLVGAVGLADHRPRVVHGFGVPGTGRAGPVVGRHPDVRSQHVAVPRRPQHAAAVLRRPGADERGIEHLGDRRPADRGAHAVQVIDYH